MSRGTRIFHLAFLLLLALVACPLLATEEGTDSIANAVLSMLEAGLTEDVILAWLEAGQEPIPRPSADQLIALQKAGASEVLLKRLLISPEVAQLPSRSNQGSKTPDPLPVDSVADEFEASAKLPSRTAPITMAQSEPSKLNREVMVNFTFSYSPWYLNDDAYDLVNDTWDFFVYMDGVPLSYVPAAAVTGMPSNLEFSQLVAPGRHIVRVTLEQHKKGKGKRWKHAARVAEEAFELEIDPNGPQASVTVRFKEKWGGIGSGGPLEFSFRQADQTTELESVGGNPESWPLICEEVEANLEAGEGTDLGAKRFLEGCVDWDALWRGAPAPPRSEVREALAMFEYRPVPKGS